MSRFSRVVITLILITYLLLIGRELGIWQITSVSAQTTNELGCDKETLDDNQYLACLHEKKAALEAKIGGTQQEAQTLASTLSIINNQAQLQRLQIAQTQTEISMLEKEIAELGDRIEGLSLSLDRLSSMLIERVSQSYKQRRTHNPFMMLARNSIRQTITQLKYLDQVEKQTAKAMADAENQRLIYDEQKNIKEIKQEKLQEKRAQLQAQQRELEASKQAKERLLAQTRNNEATYQRLLNIAASEINSFRSFVISQIGSSYCLGSPAPQPDGWFYSQRDSRWCGSSIGYSSDSVGSVGCLITSVAMIWKKYGFDVSPLTIASNTNNFWLRTAYMNDPVPTPPGFNYSRYDRRDLDLIDRELAAGRPVIVRISVSFNSVGTHFIVLKSGSGGNYVMNDPLYQADMPFDSKYSTSQITSVRTFTPG